MGYFEIPGISNSNSLIFVQIFKMLRYSHKPSVHILQWLAFYYVSLQEVLEKSMKANEYKNKVHAYYL